MLSPIAAQPLPSSTGQSRTGTSGAQTAAVQTSVTETYSRSQQVEVRGYSPGPNLSGTGGVQAYKAVEATDTALNPFAKTILSFIDAQIRRDVADGASTDELKSRLEAGLKGFEAGYHDAFKQLSGMGLLNDQIRAEIEGTRSQVLAGLQGLADELGVDLKVPQVEPQKQAQAASVLAAPKTSSSASLLEPGKALLSAVLRDVQIIEQYQKAMKAQTTYEHLGRPRSATQSQSFAYGVREDRSFSLKLRTADGDAVTIKLSANHSGSAQLTYGADRDGMSASLNRQGSQSGGLFFSVEGELDEGELRALNDFLTQVGDISEQFFNGDLGRAFELAKELSFDRSEIASFDLALTMSKTEVAQTSFADNPSAPVHARNHHQGAGGFVESVMRAGDLAERLGQPRSLVADLLDWIASTHSDNPHSALLAPTARALL
jgi:hypothetical protein